VVVVGMSSASLKTARHAVVGEVVVVVSASGLWVAGSMPRSLSFFLM
jgi:hypothetical protein